MDTFLEILNKWDTSLFLFLNRAHSSLLDQPMFWISNKLVWIPLYLLLLYFLIKFYHKETLYIMLMVALLIATSDLLSVHAFKNVFLRLRPCHEPALNGLVHIVNNKCGGDYGFYSSHASNHFAIATFLLFFLGKRLRYFTVLILFWATLISYSRIYLGVHYPGDVLAGAMAGILLGIFYAKIYDLVKKRFLPSIS
ncbi:MAG: phosphatase PAP2 family protein [Bacteroidales bacterium]|nr:phosphatase PAP2 family protein [Bacteroidales bacterium]MCF8406175.1 phosphatase PAP2 family protein [Bacteroidales bacterium]